MKPKHQRLIFIVVSLVLFIAAAMLTLQAFRENLIFFYSPSDIAQKAELPTGTIRLGGLVEDGSVKNHEDGRLTFRITDGNHAINAEFSGILPALFREGQGVVAEGTLSDANHFSAKTILAKHDETYMPKEVVDALKRSGRWQEKGPK